MSLPCYKINNSYTVYVNYHYLNDCINAGKKAADKKKKLNKEYEMFKEQYFSNRIKIGSKVSLLDIDTGIHSTVTIRSSVNFIPAKNTVSSTSPVAKTLLGRCVGEIVTITTPNGVIRCRIQKI